MPLFDLPGHLPVQAQVRWPAVAQEALPLALVRAHLIADQQAACRVVVGVAGMNENVGKPWHLPDLDHALVQAGVPLQIPLVHPPVGAQGEWVAAVRATATDPEGKQICTFGSATPDNCRSPYLLEMAEKRAKSRAVLMLCGFYEHGVFGEDEDVHRD